MTDAPAEPERRRTGEGPAGPPPPGPRADRRLSVPPRPARLPRPLTPKEHATLLAVADMLVPGTATDPCASAAPGFTGWLEVSLTARSESYETLLATVADLDAARLAGSPLDTVLRRLDAEQPELFRLLSSVVVGAYLLVPEVRRLIGYPGQGRHPPRAEDAVNDLADGILDAVVERGAVYVDPPGH